MIQTNKKEKKHKQIHSFSLFHVSPSHTYAYACTYIYIHTHHQKWKLLLLPLAFHEMTILFGIPKTHHLYIYIYRYRWILGCQQNLRICMQAGGRKWRNLSSAIPKMMMMLGIYFHQTQDPPYIIKKWTHFVGEFKFTVYCLHEYGWCCMQ